MIHNFFLVIWALAQSPLFIFLGAVGLTVLAAYAVKEALS